MKCFQHNQTDAVGTCIHCGRALCLACVTQSVSGRVICSPACGQALSAAEAALESVRQKTTTSNRYGGYFLLAAGVIFAVMVLFEIRRAVTTGRWLMVGFLAPMAVVFVVGGIAMLKMAAKKV